MKEFERYETKLTLRVQNFVWYNQVPFQKVLHTGKKNTFREMLKFRMSNRMATV